MTTLAALLQDITEADRTIDTLNRSPGPVSELLPALVHRHNTTLAALDRALHLLAQYGPIEADTADLLRLQGRLNELARKEHA